MIVKKTDVNSDVAVQIQKLKGLMNDRTSLADREHLEERIAKLSTGVSVIRVGAKTEIEGREKVERVKDAVGAAQSALREGVVPGSGVTFLRLAKYIKGTSAGANLMREVLECPIKKVMENSGEPDKIIREYINTIKDHKDVDYGYEALTGKLGSMYDAGVIDPSKVIRLSLENGISVATSILTTDVLIDYIEPTNDRG
jgi:chaperonin GroEL